MHLSICLPMHPSMHLIHLILLCTYPSMQLSMYLPIFALSQYTLYILFFEHKEVCKYTSFIKTLLSLSFPKLLKHIYIYVHCKPVYNTKPMHPKWLLDYNLIYCIIVTTTSTDICLILAFCHVDIDIYAIMVLVLF